ncbi:MAG: hypothetical protein KDH98_14745 [Calditrichaeota bacterium]|nr:hypothetical protein [Calditrichota bacterium]
MMRIKSSTPMLVVLLSLSTFLSAQQRIIFLYYFPPQNEQTVVINAWYDNGQWPAEKDVAAVLIESKLIESKINSISDRVEVEFPEKDKLIAFWNALLSDRSDSVTAIIREIQTQIGIKKTGGDFGPKSWGALIKYIYQNPDSNLVLSENNIVLQIKKIYPKEELSDSIALAKLNRQLQKTSEESWKEPYRFLPKIRFKPVMPSPLIFHSHEDQFRYAIENTGYSALKAIIQTEASLSALNRSDTLVIAGNDRQDIAFPVSINSADPLSGEIQISIKETSSSPAALYLPEPLGIRYIIKEAPSGRMSSGWYFGGGVLAATLIFGLYMWYQSRRRLHLTNFDEKTLEMVYKTNVFDEHSTHEQDPNLTIQKICRQYPRLWNGYNDIMTLLFGHRTVQFLLKKFEEDDIDSKTKKLKEKLQKDTQLTLLNWKELGNTFLFWKQKLSTVQNEFNSLRVHNESGIFSIFSETQSIPKEISEQPDSKIENGNFLKPMDEIQKKDGYLNMMVKDYKEAIEPLLPTIQAEHLQYKHIQNSFDLLNKNEYLRNLFQKVGIREIFDTHNYSNIETVKMKVGPSLSKLVALLQLVECDMPPFIKHAENQLLQIDHLLKAPTVLPSLSELWEKYIPEKHLGNYKNRIPLIDRLSVASLTDIEKKQFGKNVIILKYLDFFQWIVKKSFYYQLEIFFVKHSDLKGITQKLNLLSQVKNLLQSAAIYCGIQLHDFSPGSAFNGYYHTGIASSDDLINNPTLKEKLRKFESKWDTNNIMWIDSVGYTFLNDVPITSRTPDKSSQEMHIVKSKVLVYDSAYLE